jgi:hypothetical protein
MIGISNPFRIQCRIRNQIMVRLIKKSGIEHTGLFLAEV